METSSSVPKSLPNKNQLSTNHLQTKEGAYRRRMSFSSAMSQVERGEQKKWKPNGEMYIRERTLSNGNQRARSMSHGGQIKALATTRKISDAKEPEITELEPGFQVRKDEYEMKMAEDYDVYPDYPDRAELYLPKEEEKIDIQCYVDATKSFNDSGVYAMTSAMGNGYVLSLIHI